MESQKDREKPLSPVNPGCVPVRCIAPKHVQVPNLEAMSAPRTQLGGPERFKTPTWRSKAGLRAQLGGQKPFQDHIFIDLELFFGACQTLRIELSPARELNLHVFALLPSKISTKHSKCFRNTSQNACACFQNAPKMLPRCPKRLPRRS